MPDSNRTEPDQRLPFRLAYFDTSSWDNLAKNPKREQVIGFIRREKLRVTASVISVAEVLRTPDLDQRKLTCSTMCALHGDGPPLENPFELARAAAQAALQGDRDFVLPQRGPGESLRACMSNPTAPPTAEIKNWLCNMDRNVERFIEEIRPEQPDTTTNYLSPEILDREDFLRLLCQFPPANELGLSVSQIRNICQKSDIWKALRATLACIMNLSTTHAPKKRKSKKRPGGSRLVAGSVPWRGGDLRGER